MACLCSLLLYINIIILSRNFISLFSFPSAFESFALHSHGDREFFKLVFSLPRICTLGDLVAGKVPLFGPLFGPWLTREGCLHGPLRAEVVFCFQRLLRCFSPSTYFYLYLTAVDPSSFLTHHASDEE